MALPNNSYYPLFPLQEQIVDKDTALPLAAGTVSFFRDIARTQPKAVYQRTENPDNTFTYDSLGYILQLSSIGTFVSQSGDNIIPFLWPFVGLPSDSPVSTTVDLYYVVVESSGDVLQFTTSAWPPEVAGGSSSSNEVISSTNIISNPQFAIINYPSPYTFNVTGNTTTQIAPDWNVITSGSGSFTISQIAVVDTAAPGLPAFALSIATSGISAILSQTISMSPRILETGFGAGTFIIESNISNTAVIDMNFVPSNPSMTSKTVCTATAVNGSYTATYGTVNLSSLPNNPDSGSAGYVNVQLTIPINASVTISCVQLISVPLLTSSPAYIQDPTTRQIDHIYHDAYPIVPVGTIIDFYGFNSPLHYLLCDGSAYNRVTYNQLFNVVTLTESITQVSTTTFTADATKIGIGMFVEGAGIPVGTTVTIISAYAPSATITVSQVTTSTGTFSATFFAAGQGDGSTTFNVPDLRGRVISSADGTILNLNGTTANKINVQVGATTATLAITNMPAHNHPGSTIQVGSGGGGTLPTASNTTASTTNAVTVASQGSGTAFSIVQPTAFAYKYIRFE